MSTHPGVLTMTDKTHFDDLNKEEAHQWLLSFASKCAGEMYGDLSDRTFKMFPLDGIEEHCRRACRKHTGLMSRATAVSDAADALLVRLGPTGSGLDGDVLCARLAELDKLTGKSAMKPRSDANAY